MTAYRGQHGSVSMAVETWKLIDQPSDFQQITGERDFSGMPFSVGKRIWRGGLSEGVMSIEIATDKMAMFVLPTRGMGIWYITPADPELKWLGWKSPVRGPVHPAFVDLGGPSGLG